MNSIKKNNATKQRNKQNANIDKTQIFFCRRFEKNDKDEQMKKEEKWKFHKIENEKSVDQRNEEGRTHTR